MTIAAERFCVNRKIAPSLSIEAFFKLVSSTGLHRVELRNDLPGGSVTDNLSHQQVRALAQRYQIDIVMINAVYPFNRHSEEVRTLTEQLLREAKDVGASALVMCPLNDGSPVSQEETIDALRDLAPCSPPVAYLVLWSRWVFHKVRCALPHRPSTLSAMPVSHLNCLSIPFTTISTLKPMLSFLRLI